MRIARPVGPAAARERSRRGSRPAPVRSSRVSCPEFPAAQAASPARRCCKPSQFNDFVGPAGTVYRRRRIGDAAGAGGLTTSSSRRCRPRARWRRRVARPGAASLARLAIRGRVAPQATAALKHNTGKQLQADTLAAWLRTHRPAIPEPDARRIGWSARPAIRGFATRSRSARPAPISARTGPGPWCRRGEPAAAHGARRGRRQDQSRPGLTAAHQAQASARSGDSRVRGRGGSGPVPLRAR